MIKLSLMYMISLKRKKNYILWIILQNPNRKKRKKKRLSNKQNLKNKLLKSFLNNNLTIMIKLIKLFNNKKNNLWKNNQLSYRKLKKNPSHPDLMKQSIKFNKKSQKNRIMKKIYWVMHRLPKFPLKFRLLM